MLGSKQGLLEMVFLKFEGWAALEASAQLPELVLRGPGVGYRMPIIKAPDFPWAPALLTYYPQPSLHWREQTRRAAIGRNIRQRG